MMFLGAEMWLSWREGVPGCTGSGFDPTTYTWQDETVYISPSTGEVEKEHC